MLLIGLVRDDGDDAAFAGRLPVGLAGVTLVADCRARIDVGTKPEQDGEVRGVALLSAGQVEGDRMTIEVGLQVDFGREVAA